MADLNGIQVLVVDDDEDTRELLTIGLGVFGAEVRAAATGAEALALLDGRDGCDALVCDIGLPDTDGYSFMRTVRRRGHETVSIALTGWSSPEARAEAAQAGYTIHVAKPVEPDRLARMIARALGRGE